MRIAIYVRVSTQRQAQTQTIEQQLERLQAHAQSQGWELLDENIFRDDGYRGATLNRPGLDRLRDKVQAAEVDRMLVASPDRLARNYVQQMVLLEELEHLGCDVDDAAPWALAQQRKAGDSAAGAQLAAALYNLVETLRLVACYGTPFIPAMAEAISRQIGCPLDIEADWARWGGYPAGAAVQPGDVLFPKLELNE